MRVWGQGARVAEQQQKQQQQQRKIDNYMQSDLCCVCDTNHAQVHLFHHARRITIAATA
jgi:hypothetical protein